MELGEIRYEVDLRFGREIRLHHVITQLRKHDEMPDATGHPAGTDLHEFSAKSPKLMRVVAGVAVRHQTLPAHRPELTDLLPRMVKQPASGAGHRIIVQRGDERKARLYGGPQDT